MFNNFVLIVMCSLQTSPPPLPPFSLITLCLPLSHPGIPSPPVAPGQTNETCTCVNITWDIPEYDGAAELLNFELTVYPSGNYSLVRVFQTDRGDATNIDVCELVPNEFYNASISAINAVGPSTSVDFELVIVATEPLPPVDVVVESICENPRLCFNGHVLATWKVWWCVELVCCTCMCTCISA